MRKITCLHPLEWNWHLFDFHLSLCIFKKKYDIYNMIAEMHKEFQ